MIPNNLKARNTWVLWSWKNLKKIPFSPYTFKAASVTNCHDWASYDYTQARRANFDGIGLVLDGTENLVAIDLDKTSVDQASELIAKLDSYTEISPSGKGLRIFVYADNPLAQGNRKGSIEVYKDKRYVTVTGNSVNSCEVQERTEVFNEWYSSIFVPKAVQEPLQQVNFPTPSDSILLQRIFKHDRYAEYQQARFIGQQLDIDGKDKSRGDYFLAKCFYNWTHSRDRTKALMLTSKRVRDKWFEMRGDLNWLEYLIEQV